jgi:hypothetical protein
MKLESKTDFKYRHTFDVMITIFGNFASFGQAHTVQVDETCTTLCTLGSKYNYHYFWIFRLFYQKSIANFLLKNV